MNFEFSPEQRQMQESIRALLADRWDTARMRRQAEAPACDAGLWGALAEAGMFALPVPEALGGLGLAPIDCVLLLEEFGRALVPAPATETLLAAALIGRHGTPAQQAQYLPAIAAGTLRATIVLTEPEAEYGIAGLALRATRRGDGWVLNGRKILVPEAESCGLILVAARFKDRPGVALCAQAAPGLAMHAHAVLDRSARFHALQFADVTIPADAVLGAPAADLLFDLAAAAAAAEMTGIAARMLDDSVAYAVQRVQFGRPIGSFQAIKHRCADLATAVEGARSAAYHAALALAEDGPAAAKATSIAKAFVGEAARKACNDAIQIHGGVGFTWDLGLHLWLRRCRTLEAQYGDTAWHRERLVALSLAELGLGA